MHIGAAFWPEGALGEALGVAEGWEVEGRREEGGGMLVGEGLGVGVGGGWSGEERAGFDFAFVYGYSLHMVGYKSSFAKAQKRCRRARSDLRKSLLAPELCL